ncbi:threonylcarbamoyl-AMP synthase, partial [bacterium]|nr:threonylcarbamoyl-AMP synthase [bacterium]
KSEEIDFESFNKDLNNGAVVCFLTDTVWGFGCHPQSREGIDKIYEIKGRDRTKPLILMSDDIEYLKKYVKNIPDKAKIAIDKFFPGALTVILKKSEICSDEITSKLDTVGIRIPDCKIFSKLCALNEDRVFATTSANKSGEEPVKNFSEAKEKFSGLVDYIIDDEGILPKGFASTVAYFSENNEIKIFRQGEINLDNL